MQLWSSTSGASSYAVQVPYGVWRACINYQYSDGKWRQFKTTSSGQADSPIFATSATSGTYKKDLDTLIPVSYSSTGNTSSASNSC
jgi:hypothetical protein